MAVELVILTPVLLAFTLLIVALGRYVAVRGQVEATSRDAARAASVERSSADAATAAAAVVENTRVSGTTCAAPALSGPFVAGGTVTVTVQCEVSWNGLGLIGLPGSVQVRASSSAPLDTFRRVG